MNYQQTLTYLYAQLPVFQRDGVSAYKPNLNNALLFDAELNHPHQHYTTIHVGGTNGKGSVSNLIASVLQHTGLKVGLYTSPHLKDFRERIRVNGKPISKRYVCSFVEKHAPFIEKLNPSFFETTMCMAFSYFAEEKVDIAVIEVGLGGRLDSTNIIHPILSIITNISFDHMNLLGDSLEKIAQEKAGIIKKNTPTLIGETQKETSSIFTQQANALQAPLFFADQLLPGKITAQKNASIEGSFKGFEYLSIGLGGLYQIKNASTALVAIQLLREKGITIPDKAIRKGFKTVCKTTGLQGRWHILQKKPLVICDTGHNEAGIAYVVEQLKTLTYKQLRIVFGVVNDKDCSKIMALLPVNAIYYFCKAAIPRALNEKELQIKAANVGLQGKTYKTVKEALDAAIQEADSDDVIFVGGSTFVVAEIL